MIVTLCADPNDGTHGLFIDGKRVLDSRDDDVSVTDLFWPEALAAVCEALGATLVEESRYRPSHKVGGSPFDPDEWESYWPETLEGMGPVEPPIGVEVDFAVEEEANPNWIF